MNTDSKAAHDDDNSPGVGSAGMPIATANPILWLRDILATIVTYVTNKKGAETLRFVARHTANEPHARGHRMRALTLISIN
jgi:hypothetical protein